MMGKAGEDQFGIHKKMHSFVEYGHAQGHVPLVEIKRYISNWANFGGWYKPVTVQNETIHIRARLDKRFRRTVNDRKKVC